MNEKLPSEAKFEDDFGRAIDPRSQCPDGLLHDFKPVKGGAKGQRCIKCGLTEEDINEFFSRKGITFHGG